MKLYKLKIIIPPTFKLKIPRLHRLNIWLVLFGLLSIHQGIAQCHIDDWTALKALYENTDGDNWTNNTGWEEVTGNQPTTNCNLNLLHGIELDNLGRVETINLKRNGLIGSIPSELGKINNLKVLILSDNGLSGSIPSELGNLSNLEFLNVARNQLNGSIPQTFGNLSNLETLGLADNQLIGGIPTELGNLTNLVSLIIANNNFEGCFADNLMSLCEQLKSFYSENVIDLGNNFEAPWRDFCRYGSDACLIIRDCTDIIATNYNPNATVDDGSCEYENNFPVFETYPWLDEYVDPNNCNGTSIIVYDTGEENFILIRKAIYSRLYSENGAIYCYETSTYSCVDANGLNNISQSWSCENNNSLMGCTDLHATNFDPRATTDDRSCRYVCAEEDPLQMPWIQNLIDRSDGCNTSEISQFEYDGAIYFLVETGPQNPCLTNKRYGAYDCRGHRRCTPVTPTCCAVFCNSEMTNASNNATVIWRHRDEVQTPIFQNYPWLNTYVDPDNCNRQKILVYDGGSNNYIFIQNGSDNKLYFEDGTLHCNHTPTNSCITSNNLKTIVQTWTCGDDIDNGSNTNQLDLITCPENSLITVCAPVAMPPSLTLENFNTSNDPNYTNSMSMQMEEQTDVQKYFNTTTRVYSITDENGNQKTCETKYHIANQFLQAPEVSDPGVVCQENLWSSIKIGTDQYKIYADNNGAKGEEMSTCNTSNLICSTADLGVDTKMPGTYSFWASTYFEFPDGTICESEVAPFKIDIQQRPIAELSLQNKTINIGEGIALMDLVATNKSGYWSGESIIYLMTANGENIAYFSANTTGVNKLYYTVRNEFCERSYLLIVEVDGASGKPGTIGQMSMPISKSINIYPNQSGETSRNRV